MKLLSLIFIFIFTKFISLIVYQKNIIVSSNVMKINLFLRLHIKNILLNIKNNIIAQLKLDQSKAQETISG